MFYHQPITEDRSAQVAPLSDPIGGSGLVNFDEEGRSRIQARAPAGMTPMKPVGVPLNTTGTPQGFLATPTRPFNEHVAD